MRRIMPMVILAAWTNACSLDLSRATFDGNPIADGRSGDADSGATIDGDATTAVHDGREGDIGRCATSSCPLGCDISRRRCKRLQATNFDPTGFFDQILGPLHVAAKTTTIDTDTGEIKSGATVVRPPGKTGVSGGISWQLLDQGAGFPKLSLMGVSSLDVTKGATLEINGVAALAIYAKHTVDISGTIISAPKDAAPAAGGYAAGATNGGSGTPCHGGQGGGGADFGACNAGGGGGGNGTTGGGGGATSCGRKPAPGLGGASTRSAAPKLSPLFGGCGGGGSGQSPGVVGGAGGGGGGALQLVANGAMTIRGVISLPGEGGDGCGRYSGGGGGGAGGTLLLEAAAVSVSGMLAANGGGGGGAGSSCGRGQRGQANATPTKGGTGSRGAIGGAGGAAATPAGQPGKSWNLYGAGGGGGAGRIRINAPSIIIAAANASPAPEKNTSVKTW